MLSRTNLVMAATLATPLVFTAGVTAETVNCTAITSAPAYILQPGSYCLTGDIVVAMTDGGETGVSIWSDDVVLDLNGFRLANTKPETMATGVFASGRRNVTVRNGVIEGFSQAVALVAANEAVLVEDIHALRSRHLGVAVMGPGAMVRRCRITKVGDGSGNATGIWLVGGTPHIVDNDIDDIPTGTAIKIDNQTSSALVVGNRITNAYQGVAFAEKSAGKYRDNTTFNVQEPYTGGTDGGGNN